MAGVDEQINVLIAVSNRVVCIGLKKIAAEDPQHNAQCQHLMDSFFQPDIIIFDSGQDLQVLQVAYPTAKPILLDTGLKDQEIACYLICHKTKGIISPDANLEMFHKAIKVVSEGEIWVDQKHLKSLLRKNGVMAGKDDIKGLNSRDKKIIQLISRGQKNREIGEQLCLSEHTIKAHVSRIFKRLNVSNRAQLASLAKEYDAELHQLS